MKIVNEIFGEGFSYRSHQEKAVDFALESFSGRKDVVIFEAPTGFGKSIANIIIANGYPRVFYTSPQVALVDQLSDDSMLKSHVDAVYGKSHYDCIEEEVTIDIAPCQKGVRCAECHGTGFGGNCRRCKGHGTVPYECKSAEPRGGLAPECPYYKDKWNAAHGQVAVTTLAYMLLASTPSHEPLDETWNLVKGRFPPRDLLIVDEAHGTADYASSFISLTLSQYTLRGVQAWRETWDKMESRALSVRKMGDAVEFLTGALIPELQRDIKGLKAVWRETGREGERTKILRDIERIGLLLERVDMAVRDMKMNYPWAIDPKRDVKKEKRKLVLQPVLIGPFLRRRLWNRADQYLLSTATVLDANLLLKELGLEDKRTVIMRIPSIFPPENAPVIDVTVGSLTKKHKHRNLPKALKALCRILDKEKGRGLIHCHSYENAVYIKENIPPRYRGRLVFHESADRGNVLNGWLANEKEDSVLVSVAMTEGLDLRDELARWAVIFKVPYPYLGDKRIAERLKLPDGGHWYRLTTLKAIVQASGRIIRSEDDEGRVYVLDSAIHTLLRQTSKWVPDWFKARMEAGGWFSSRSPTIDTAHLTGRNSL
ncbi:MAG: hypothetical protein KAW09_12415 [Thermoplasmata archaeon]|nr:hypothetical protein [Thermoplasmata archaeon]